MLKLDLQLFGGRGASSSLGGATGGLDPNNIVSTTSLISYPGKSTEINQTLEVLRSISDDYGVTLEDVQVATLKGAGQMVMGYYDSQGNLAFNQSYFDGNKLNGAYDRNVETGYHPSRGNKSAIEAVAAHEAGHALTEKAAGGWNKLDSTADKIVKEAAKNAGYGKDLRRFAGKISGYAKESAAEAVAEAFSDVYCNGNKASRESRAVVNSLNKYFGR